MERNNKLFNPRDWSIIIKLSVALLLAALLPMIITALFNLNGSLTTVEATELSNLEVLAKSTANRLNQLTDDASYSVTQIAGDTEIVAMLAADTTDIQESYRESVEFSLDNALASNPYYEYIYLMDANGYVIVSRQLEGLPSIQDRRFVDRAYFLQAMIGNDFVDTLVGRSSGKLGFYFSTPVYVEGQEKPVGVAIIKLQGIALTNVINEITTDLGQAGYYAFLVDQDGVIVSHDIEEWYYNSLQPLEEETRNKVGARFVQPNCPDEDGNYEGCHIASLGILPELRHLDAGASGSAQYTSPADNASQVVGYAATNDRLSWVVGVNNSRRQFQEPLYALALSSLVLVMIAAVLVTFLALRIAQGIAWPIRKLANVAQDVEEDKAFSLEDIADVSSHGDEVGHLANVFGHMVLALRARMAELQTIYKIGAQISSSVELDTTLHYILDSIGSAINYDAAEICLYDDQKNLMILNASLSRDKVGQEYQKGVANEDDENEEPVEEQPSYNAELGYVSVLVAKKDGLLISDTNKYTDVEQNPERTWLDVEPRSYLGVPLQSKGKVIGSIELVQHEVDGFNEANLRVLESIALQAAIAVQNAQQVIKRESALKERIQKLRIEIDAGKRQQQVDQIVGTDYFQSLQEKARNMRKRRKD